MRKIGFITILTVFFTSQIMLAGASVLCVTQDGQTHLERTDEHGHCIGRPDADCASHIHDGALSAVLCVTESHCHDIPLSQTSMTVVSLKRFSKTPVCDYSTDMGIKLNTARRAVQLTSSAPVSRQHLTTLQTIVLQV